MAGIETSILLIAIASGVIPTFIWLLFWLHEDRFQPEPRGLLVLTFIAGMISVFLTIPLGDFVRSYFSEHEHLIFIFAGIEEIMKFSVVFLIDFNSSYLDEPIDYAIYLITGSLGFATMENILFLLSSGTETTASFIIETGSLRFLGATILHSILAATLGIILGFVFYKSKLTRFMHGLAGIILVTILHTFFNYFIIKSIEMNGFLILGILWIITLIIIALFEQVRRVNH